MPTPSLRIALLAVIAVVPGACTSQHASRLDGPIDYKSEGGFFPSRTSVHIELDGSAQKQVMTGTGPTMTTSGTVSAAMLDALRGHIAGVDLASFRDDYNCADYVCSTDFPVITLAIAADGTVKQTRVDRGIDDHDLPAGLVAIISDLDAIVAQLP